MAIAAHMLHDHVLLHLEQPQQAHLLEEVHELGLETFAILDDHGKLQETSPLVVRAGTHAVYTAYDMDLVSLETKLHDDERSAVAEDLAVPTRRVLREELEGLVKLSLPITGTAILEMVPPLLTMMLVGHVSGRDAPHVIAASTLADFVTTQTSTNLIMGMSAVVSTMCAQAFGAKQYRQLWLYAQAGLVACTYSLAPIAVVCMNGESILRLVGQDPALAHTARTFILIALPAVPFIMVYTIAASALQAQNIATPFIFASALAYAIALPLAYVVGYYTDWGYVGVMLCVTLSNMIKVAVVIPVLFRNPLFVEAWPGWQWGDAHRLARQLGPLMVGGIVMATSLALGLSLTGLLCGLLPNPAEVMSASSLASLLLTLAYIPMVGISAAGTVRVGNALGAGQPRRASVATAGLFMVTLAVSAVGVCVCWSLATPYMRANTSDEPTIRIAVLLSTHLLPFIPLSSCVLALQSVFQACGELWLGAKLNFVCLVALAVPLGLVLALRFHGGVFGLWNGQLLGSLGFIISAAMWIHRLDWHAVAHQARLNAHVHVEVEPSHAA